MLTNFTCVGIMDRKEYKDIMFADITFIEWLTVAALFFGPIAAVRVTRKIDQRREIERRKWEIFRNLMCFRRHPLSRGFVSSLNLIEVEFHDNDDVLKAWKDLFKHFDRNPPNNEDLQREIEEGDKLRALLLKKVAESLNINLDSLDMFKSGYSPQGWGELELEETLVRKMLGEVLLGERAFPVSIERVTKIVKNTPNSNHLQPPL